MKKKSLCIFVLVLIIANVILFPTSVTKKQSQLSLTLIEARADDGGETDPTDPDEKYPPLRPFPSDSTFFLINSLVF